MKKLTVITLVMVLALSILSGCSGGNNNSGSGNTTPSNSDNNDTPASDSGGNGNNTNATANKDANGHIKPSELISLEDATRLLGEDAKVYKDDYDNYYDKVETIYKKITTKYDAKNNSTMGLLQIFVYWSSNKPFKADLEEKEEEGTAIKVDGIGDWAFLSDLDKLVASIMIGYGDYIVEIATDGKPNGSDYKQYTDEHVAWRTEFLTETGKFAAERLKALVR